jgi:hypothetical protein
MVTRVMEGQFLANKVTDPFRTPFEDDLLFSDRFKFGQIIMTMKAESKCSNRLLSGISSGDAEQGMVDAGH